MVSPSVGPIFDFVTNLWFRFSKANTKQRTFDSGVLRLFTIKEPYVFENIKKPGGFHERVDNNKRAIF